MAHFVYDSIARVDKGNLVVVPSGGDVTRYVQAGDWNDLQQDLRDLREAISGRPTHKDACRIATTANDGLSGLAARDGVTPAAGDRVLVKNQSTGSQNGVYIANSGSWARAFDASSDPEVRSGMVVRVAEGSTQAGTAWYLSTPDPIVVGTTSLAFAQVGAAPAFGEVSQQANASATTVSDQTSFFLVVLSAPALSGLESSFDNPSGHRLRYTGGQTRTFRVNVVGGVIGGGTTPDALLFRLAKNGTTLSKSEQPTMFRTAALSDHFSLQVVVSLAQNDYLELYVRNVTAAQNVTVTYLNMQASVLT
jgi:hypothetical protein